MVNLAPFYTPSVLSQTRFIKFSKIESKKSFNSFISSFNSNINLQISKSLFSNHLKTPIKLLSETYTLLNAQERLSLNQNANTRSILDFLTQDKISTLENENQSLRLSASQQAQNNYLVNALRPAPVPAFSVPAPYCYSGCGNYYNNGCGCC